MAAPVVNTASVVQSPNAAGTSITLNIPISAAGNDRLVFIAGVSKDNSTTVNVLSSMVFDSAGVNLSVGSGITQVTARQIAQEGQYSSQSDVYVIKEADLPASAGTYAIDITMDGAMQYLYWIAFEVTGANQTLDATATYTNTVDVSAGGSYSTSITTTVADCLVLDFWGQSDSSIPTITPLTGQTQIGSNFRNTNGGGNCSYKVQATAGSVTMGQTTSTLSQRQAGILVSVAPASAGTVISPGSATYQAYSGQSYNVAAETLILVNAATIAVLIGQTYSVIKERLITVGAGVYQSYAGQTLNVIRATVISPAAGTYQQYLGQALTVSNGTVISVATAVMASLVGQTYNLIKATVIQPAAAIYQRLVGTVPAVIKGGGSTVVEAARRLVNMASYLRRR